MKQFKIALSNIKNRKASAITLLSIIMIAALMFSIGLSLIMGVGSFFQRKADELNAAHLTLVIPTSDFNEEKNEHMQGAENLEIIEMSDTYVGTVRYSIQSKEFSVQFMFAKEPVNPIINKFEIIDRLSHKPENYIILPTPFKFSGLKSGDNFLIESGPTTYSFVVYGFFENLILGTGGSAKIVYVSEGTLNNVANDNNLNPCIYASFRFKHEDDARIYLDKFIAKFSRNDLYFATLNGASQNVTIFPMIMAIILVFVALIVVIISLVLIRFAIINSIDEGIKTLGALKSIGFTSRQIISATVLQFVLVAFGGVLLGGILAIALSGTVGNIISSTGGIRWSSISMTMPIIIMLISLMGMVALATYIIARRSKSITPINALRQGLSNHSFKKSAVSLEKSNLPLIASMSVKQFKVNIKNNISAFIVIVLCAYMTVLGLTLTHNFVLDTSAYSQMSGFEPAQIQIDASDEFAIEHFGQIVQRENVRKTLERREITVASTDKADVSFNVTAWEDITQKETNTVFRGRYPRANNEITLLAYVSNLLGKDIGDMVTIRTPDGEPQSYLVVGLTQSMGGAEANVTFEGGKRLLDNLVFNKMFIYLYDESEEALNNFVNGLITDFGREIYIVNWIAMFDEFVEGMRMPIVMATILVSAIIVSVIVLVLFLMCSTIIRRNKKEAGIKKALGFTSRQLIMQMLLGFAPVVLAGVLLGTIIGIFATNPMLGMMFSMIGIAKAMFTLPPLLISMCTLSLTAVAFLTLYLTSLKYKKIEVHKLIVE